MGVGLGGGPRQGGQHGASVQLAPARGHVLIRAQQVGGAGAAVQPARHQPFSIYHHGTAGGGVATGPPRHQK